MRGSGPIKGPSASSGGHRGEGAEGRGMDGDSRAREGTEGCPMPTDQGEVGEKQQSRGALWPAKRCVAASDTG